MRIIRDFAEYKGFGEGLSITIGNFDGVHLGHRALLQKTKDIARSRGLKSAAITFEPHPLRILKPEKAPKRICTPEHKIELIEKIGLDILFVIGFTYEFSLIDPEEFVCFLIRELGVKELIVGYDYSFGRNRKGNIEFLRSKSVEFGFGFHVLPPVEVDGIPVSSSRIRDCLEAGDVRLATRLLGHYYQMRGVVIRGDKRGGALLGIPTANLNLYQEEVLPKVGVYVVQVIFDQSCYGGLLNIGYNPTFSCNKLSVEAHILDFNENIYGKTLKINLIDRIRDEKRFNSPAELVETIRQDIQIGRMILAEEKNLVEACNENIG